MKKRFDLLAALAVCLLAGCSDPADSVPKSSASDPAKTAPTSGGAPDSSAPAAAAQAGKSYIIRSESTVGFTGSKVTGSHNGGFKNVAGSFTVQGGKITGAPEIKIGMKSIFTDTDRLTGHLQSPDFFDVAKYPVSTFTVTAIEGAGPTNKVTGNLDLHGVSKSISFPAAVQISDDAVAVKAAFAINRKQWNINYAGKANDLIRDNVIIRLDLKATPGAARPEDQLAN
ncbi:MAG TPA: YceI family protein [Verrucomicrobiae bacterium]|nr:YceI family protein [Verrucomicrobiae bacterium]